jgi:hypothetical protein
MAVTPISQTITQYPADKLIVVGQQNEPENIEYIASADGLPRTSTEINTLVGQLNTSIGQINTSVSEVNTNAQTATTKANEASASATASASSANVTGWVSVNTYTLGQNVFSQINYQTYRRKTVGAGTTDPANDSTNWEALKSPLALNTKDYFAISGQVNKNARTSFYTFTDTTPNNLNVSASDWYFKSLNKTVSTIGRSITFPTAPTGTNLVSNGTFDSDTSGWSKGANSTISVISGELSVSIVATESFYQLDKLIIGKKYIIEYKLVSKTSGTLKLWNNGAWLLLPQSVGYNRFEFTALTTSIVIGNELGTTLVATLDNIAVFVATDLLRYDNLLLRDDGTYFITQTEQNQYITMDTMLNYTSLLYSVDTGVSTGTSVTMTYDMTNECYNGSDGRKYITVGSTARFNQGAYHPVFNSGGTMALQSTTNSSYARIWHDTIAGGPNGIAKVPSNIANCFDAVNYLPINNASGYGTGAYSGNGDNAGYWSGSTDIIGNTRPDSKFYDIIYNELFIDQRWRAEYIDGTKERTTIERDKDISASQYADFVGSAKLETYANPTSKTKKRYIQGITHEYIRESNLRYGSNQFFDNDIINIDDWATAISALDGGGTISGVAQYIKEDDTTAITETDVTVKLRSKAISSYGMLTLSGSTWTPTTPTLDTTNDIIPVAKSSGNVVIINYKAYNNNLAPIANSRVIGGSAGVSDVWAGNSYIKTYSGVVSGLINKVPTLDIPSPNTLSTNTPIKFINFEDESVAKIHPIRSNTTHDTIALYGSTSPAVKTFSYLTQSKRAKQVYVFSEMKYDGTDFGDDNTFRITDNTSTFTNLNGVICLYGQKGRLVDGRIKE